LLKSSKTPNQAVFIKYHSPNRIKKYSLRLPLIKISPRKGLLKIISKFASKSIHLLGPIL
jgi:hypothetical protein